MSKCIICGRQYSSYTYLTVKEMMFGTRDTFNYFECEKCGTVQIINIPDDLSKYYPQNYYSYKCSSVNKSTLKSFLKKKLAKYVLRRKSIIGRLIQHFHVIPDILRWIKNAAVDIDSKILDVGCGTGTLLLEFEQFGFKYLEGVDPFIFNDIFYDNGVRILKKHLSEIRGSFNLIMFHHSLEHIANPHEHLLTVRQLLEPNGAVLIRIPIAGTFAWKHYHINWVQLDAPRHLFLPTVRAMHLLAQQCGFEVFKTEFDSTAFQFWGSEQYLRDIPLSDKRSYSISPKQSIFSDSDIQTFEARAKLLNTKSQGDQACFYLRKR